MIVNATDFREASNNSFTNVVGVKDSRERTRLTGAEMAEIKRLFRGGMAADAFSFSADKSLEDRPGDGSCLPT